MALCCTWEGAGEETRPDEGGEGVEDLGLETVDVGDGLGNVVDGGGRRTLVQELRLQLQLQLRLLLLRSRLHVHHHHLNFLPLRRLQLSYLSPRILGPSPEKLHKRQKKKKDKAIGPRVARLQPVRHTQNSVSV